MHQTIHLYGYPNHPLAVTVQQVCDKIAPLWPLSHFVAVNPFVGFADQSFAATAAQYQRIQGADTVMPLKWYREQYTHRIIGMEDIRAAVANAPQEVRESFAAVAEPLTVDTLLRDVSTPADTEPPTLQPEPFSSFLDQRENTHWQPFIRTETAKWCAAFFDQGQSAWSLPWKSATLYQAWQQAAACDQNPRCNGLKKFCSMAATLPASPIQAIERALTALNIPQARTEEFLYRVLLMVPGWSGHLRYLDRERALQGETSNWLVQLLAIILNYEVILFHHFESDPDRVLGWQRSLLEDPTDTGEPMVNFELAQRLVWQAAIEHAIEQHIKASIQPNTAPSHTPPARPTVQAAFCIDVRSEILRRSLEALHPDLQTIGFAGFFGIALDHSHPNQETSQARCPVLLAPSTKSCECRSGRVTAAATAHRASLRGSKRFREAAASSFSFVETLGLSYAYKLVKDALGLPSRNSHSQPSSPTIVQAMDLHQKAAMTKNILQGLNLVDNFAPLILLCGHGSETCNNPYGSSLDCGACGGHAGDANARIVASLCNDTAVRTILKEDGIHIPDDTYFIAGLHNTTTDAVILFDVDTSPRTLQPAIRELQTHLRQAGQHTALERAFRLDGQHSSTATLRKVQHRSRDWSQVRPEWGLAGNTAFIVAPRAWTRRANLEGRVFLHDYDAQLDTDASVLEAIIGGPLVVGSWINLQYYGSAVDNAHFGSGHKSIHNVVGGIGVALGNEYDLSPGLPWQSVHNGDQLMHEPARLLACIAAEPDRIDVILSRQPHVTHLVENQWIHLIALGADGKSWKRRLPNNSWQSQQPLGKTMH